MSAKAKGVLRKKREEKKDEKRGGNLQRSHRLELQKVCRKFVTDCSSKIFKARAVRGVHVKAAEVRWVVPGNTKDGFRSIVVSDFELVEFNLVLVVTQAAREACTFCKRKGKKKKEQKKQ